MTSANDINDIQPSSLSHLIGQTGVRQQVTVALDAAQMDGQKFDHALLVGGPGLGKSQMASVIAQEMASEFHEVLGQSIQSKADLNALLLDAAEKDVVHIDECHELEKRHQTALYLSLDQRKIFLDGKGRNGKPTSIPLNDFTLLLSTTDEYGLLQPLRDRMKLALRFEFYSVHELVELTRQRTRGLGWAVEEAIFPMIAQRARGTPRLALRLLQSARRVSRAEGQSTITEPHLQRACDLEQIDSLGLGVTEQRYMRLLADGANRLNVVASMLGLPRRTVSEVTETFLIRAGLVIKDDQGRRQLTRKGREHLASVSCGGVVQ